MIDTTIDVAQTQQTALTKQQQSHRRRLLTGRDLELLVRIASHSNGYELRQFENTSIESWLFGWEREREERQRATDREHLQNLLNAGVVTGGVTKDFDREVKVVIATETGNAEVERLRSDRDTRLAEVVKDADTAWKLLEVATSGLDQTWQALKHCDSAVLFETQHAWEQAGTVAVEAANAWKEASRRVTEVADGCENVAWPGFESSGWTEKALELTGINLTLPLASKVHEQLRDLEAWQRDHLSATLAARDTTAKPRTDDTPAPSDTTAVSATEPEAPAPALEPEAPAPTLEPESPVVPATEPEAPAPTLEPESPVVPATKPEAPWPAAVVDSAARWWRLIAFISAPAAFVIGVLAVLAVQ